MGILKKVVAFTTYNADGLSKFGLDTCVIPLGYYKEMGQRLDMNRDIDVLFIGSLQNQRRREIVTRLRKYLTSAGLRVVIMDEETTRIRRATECRDPGYSTEPRSSWVSCDRHQTIMSSGRRLPPRTVPSLSARPWDLDAMVPLYSASTSPWLPLVS